MTRPAQGGSFLINKNNQKGFTLIEVIVAIAVVAILAGVITPSIIKHLDDSKRARAQNDCLVRACDKISDALRRERRAGRCKAARRRRCDDIVGERQRRRCPPAAAPLRAAARRPADCVVRSSHTTRYARRSRLASGPGGRQRSASLILSQALIGAAIGSFYKDLGRMPNIDATGDATVTLLVGTGNIPSLATGVTTWNTATTAATCDFLSNHLSANTPESQSTNIYPTTATSPGFEFVWRGPYQSSITSDPWGNRYAVNIGNMTAAYPAVWVISAGPDGIIQTSFSPAAPAAGTTLMASGDDIVYRIR